MTPAEPAANPGSQRRFLTVQEVATRLRASRWSVTARCRNGELEATKPFGTWLIPEDVVEELLRSSTKAGKPDSEGAA